MFTRVFILCLFEWFDIAEPRRCKNRDDQILTLFLIARPAKNTLTTSTGDCCVPSTWEKNTKARLFWWLAKFLSVEAQAAGKNRRLRIVGDSENKREKGGMSSGNLNMILFSVGRSGFSLWRNPKTRAKGITRRQTSRAARTCTHRNAPTFFAVASVQLAGFYVTERTRTAAKMVYSSDFYTTRRPYTRPYSSSYTVTVSLAPFKNITSRLATNLSFFFHLRQSSIGSISLSICKKKLGTLSKCNLMRKKEVNICKLQSVGLCMIFCTMKIPTDSNEIWKTFLWEKKEMLVRIGKE